MYMYIHIAHITPLTSHTSNTYHTSCLPQLTFLTPSHSRTSNTYHTSHPHTSHPHSSPLTPLTEYCASRAVPSVAASQYLLHIGAELDPGIDIMWTGGCMYMVYCTLAQYKKIILRSTLFLQCIFLCSCVYCKLELVQNVIHIQITTFDVVSIILTR